MSKSIKFALLILIVAWLMRVVACAPQVGETEGTVIESTEEKVTVEPTNSAQPAEPPLLMPGEPPASERTLEDSDSSIRAYENRVLSGDKFLDNLYERPFTSQEMIYQPELDIFTADIAQDENFFYFTIILNPVDAESPGLIGTYGVEFDRTKTGRGDLIVLAGKLKGEWSIEGVKVFTDSDTDVGGPNPMLADEGFEGNGYDTQVTFESDKVAYARISPDDPDTAQIAVSRALLENPEEFLWGAWADNGLKDVTLFDYNDAMGLHEAGSPIRDNEDYPIKNLYSLDNTCRLPYGFSQVESIIPGMCMTTENLGCKKVCVQSICSERPPSCTCIKWECK